MCPSRRVCQPQSMRHAMISENDKFQPRRQMIDARGIASAEAIGQPSVFLELTLAQRLGLIDRKILSDSDAVLLSIAAIIDAAQNYLDQNEQKALTDNLARFLAEYDPKDCAIVACVVDMW